MKKLTKSQRESLRIAEANNVAKVFAQHLSKADDYERGIKALDAYWLKKRTSPLARWIRFEVLSYKADLLTRLGRLEDALRLSMRLVSLPAAPDGRILADATRAGLLRRTGRMAEAFQCAMLGLRRCVRAEEVDLSRHLILEIIRLRKQAYVEELGAEHGELVMKAAKRPVFAEIVGPEVQTPAGVLESLAKHYGA